MRPSVIASCFVFGTAVAGGFLVLLRDEAPVQARVALGPTKFASTAPEPRADQDLEAPSLPKELALKQVYTLNQSAFIPPQCYTKTIDEAGRVHNPCYTCHVSSRAPNYINDADVQLEYAFVPRARKNNWKNLFVDWSQRIGATSDDEILSYVRTSNYFDEAQNPILERRLAAPPVEWDHDSDGKWSGFIPDARFAFDTEGFDRTPAGKYSGWRAFAYYPVPGTFWPTNGSMSDVLMRLPEAFRKGASGNFELGIYKLNFAIVEAVVTRRSVVIDVTDEAAVGVDLDQNGSMGRAREVRFVASPEAGDRATPSMSFVGRARAEQEAGRVHLFAGLYPEGTEFLHSVRYLDPTESGMSMAPRMKELRYAKKVEWWSDARLDKRARVEAISKVDSPTELRNFGGNIELGVNNGQGWTLQGFIEDAEGALRPQSFEETVYCVGCHGGIGAVDDSIFSFSRKLGPKAFQAGYYHWSQRGLEGVRDRPLVGGGTEYVEYLERNGAGDEFRQNAEIIERFFAGPGQLKPGMKERLQRDISEVLLPSRERALQLDKAYRLLVQEQSFRHGREIVLNGARNVHRTVEAGQKTGVATPFEPAFQRPVPQEKLQASVTMTLPKLHSNQTQTQAMLPSGSRAEPAVVQ